MQFLIEKLFKIYIEIRMKNVLSVKRSWVISLPRNNCLLSLMSPKSIQVKLVTLILDF